LAGNEVSPQGYPQILWINKRPISPGNPATSKSAGFQSFRRYTGCSAAREKRLFLPTMATDTLIEQGQVSPQALSDSTPEKKPDTQPGKQASSASIPSFVRIAVPSPLYRLFDYSWPYAEKPVPGQRVTVPFGKRSVVGIVVLGIDSTEVPANKLRRVTRLHEATPLLPQDLMELLQWASRYYQHPPGEVLATALPASLRKGE